MATKKDLVEAHAFSRRRLVTAFVSGAPGGREVEPVRPGRVLIGGIALSVLLLAGAAIAGFLLGRPPAQWLDEGSFVISKDTGEQYVVLRGGDDPRLQRVPNYVSAQLLLERADLTPYTVRDKYIRTVQLGEDLGIEGAPAGLPSADELVDDGWTACTGAGVGIKVAIQQRPGVEDLTGSAFLVSSGRGQWLIATSPAVGAEQGRAYRFAMPTDPTESSTLAQRLGFSATPVEVDADWLNLFPLGADLEADSFGVEDLGKPVPYDGTGTDLSDHRIGELLLSGSGDYFLLGDQGPQELSAFAGEVYAVVGGQAPTEIPESPSARFDDPDTPTEWPNGLPAAVTGGALCAVLHPEADADTTVSLATNPTDAADPAEVGSGRHEVAVEPSAGAYVLSGSDEAADGGSPYVIDTLGEKYGLGPRVPEFIGYADVDPPLVPSTWLRFFQPGVPLTTNSARRVPEDAAPASDDAGDSGS